MPPKLSARQLFWAGLMLTAVGVFIGQFLAAAVYGLWGEDAINSSPVRLLTDTSWPVIVPLGVALLACSVIARVIESQPASATETDSWRPMPSKLTSRQILWAGVILVVVGLLLTSMSNLLLDLRGRSDLSANLVRDLWTFIGTPLSAIAVPLGIALVPSAFVVRVLESRVRDPHEESAEEFTGR